MPKHRANAPQISSDLNEVPSVSLIDSETVECEGESSLDAHSFAARDLLVQTLGNHSQVRNNPRMITALASLRQIVEADRVEASQQQKLKLTGLGRPRQLIYELKLPPTEGVLEILRKSKGMLGSHNWLPTSATDPSFLLTPPRTNDLCLQPSVGFCTS